MALNIDQILNDFLRDAQYRVGELSIEMDVMDDSSDYGYIEKREHRSELTAFMNIIWWSYDNLYSGYNLLSANEDWTDREIASEIEYLRKKTGLNNVPYFSFANFVTQVVSVDVEGGSGSSSTGLPAGNPDQYLIFNSSRQLVAAEFPRYGGMKRNQSINDYFRNRL